ncbi:MAG: PIN domain-containing protein [Chloroflexota bacterium]
MSVLIDTSILIDYLRGHPGAAAVMVRYGSVGPLHASEVTRLEVLAGTRPAEEEVSDLAPTGCRGSRGGWRPRSALVAKLPHNRYR